MMKTGAERKRKSQARVISRTSIQGMSRPSREHVPNHVSCTFESRWCLRWRVSLFLRKMTGHKKQRVWKWFFSLALETKRILIKTKVWTWHAVVIKTSDLTIKSTFYQKPIGFFQIGFGRRPTVNYRVCWKFPEKRRRENKLIWP